MGECSGVIVSHNLVLPSEELKYQKIAFFCFPAEEVYVCG